MSRKKLPEFNTIEEMAAFWDAHDSTEFEEGTIETVEYSPKSLVQTVRFEAGDMLAISRAARRLGVDRSTFIRMAVKQFLENHSPK
ncbi:MAG: CopG family antitoxin [Bacillota bacterium]|jgi:predicted DNA binding CopG/RHH family protein